MRFASFRIDGDATYGVALSDSELIDLKAVSGSDAPENSDLFRRQPHLENTMFPVPDSPGLGIELNEDALKAGDFRFWEPSHLRRNDGSYTNW